MKRIEYAILCVGALHAMPEDKRQELLEWERVNLSNNRDGDLGSIDWPGWIPILGPPPPLEFADRPYKKKPIRPSLRTKVFERDRYRCVNCGTWEKLTADHIVPEVLGGTTELYNLQTLCKPCNSKKGAR